MMSIVHRMRTARRPLRSVFTLLNVLILAGLGVMGVAAAVVRGGTGGVSPPVAWLVAGIVFLVSCCAIFAVLIAGGVANRRLFLLLVVGIAAIEGAGHYLRSRGSFDDDAYRMPRPYVMFTGRPGDYHGLVDFMSRDPQARYDLHINSNGVRLPNDIRPGPHPGETRICMLGGSTVFQGASLERTIAGFLERQFHESGRADVRVLNFGVVSFVSTQELALLLHTVVDFKPDLVVVYDGGNDIFTPYVYDPRPGYPYNFYAVENAAERARTETAGQLASALASRSFLISTALNWSPRAGGAAPNDARRAVGYGTTEWEEGVIRCYRDNLEKMCALAGAYDFRLAVFLQPMAILKHPLVGVEKQRADAGDPALGAYIVRQYERARQSLADLAGAHPADDRCRFADISQMFEGCDRELYWDVIHTDHAGNEMIAKEIFSRLREMQLLDVSQRTD